ncbi:hypothetical protein FOL47_004603 [Perkinsus chesapeaki]|uniref:Uncharacterized protein n=1 Tax=Perkinsus chesapeaki TaxID=330153 RepID=A0A7J6M1Z3_PERCH|nr:hypothetical protein FOL47_004603 [Perkinsus chesapeaki]
MSEDSRRILEYQPNTFLPQLSLQRRCADGQVYLDEPARPTGLPRPNSVPPQGSLPSLSLPVLGGTAELERAPSTPCSVKAMDHSEALKTPLSASIRPPCTTPEAKRRRIVMHGRRMMTIEEASVGLDGRDVFFAKSMKSVSASESSIIEPGSSGRPSSARRSPSPCPQVCKLPQLGSAPQRKSTERRLPCRRSNVSESGLPCVVVQAPSSPGPSLRLSALPPLTPPRSRGMRRKRRREDSEGSSRVREASRASELGYSSKGGTVLPPSPRVLKKEEDETDTKTPESSMPPRVPKRRMVKSETGSEAASEYSVSGEGGKRGLLGLSSLMAREAARLNVGACVQCTAVRPPQQPRHHGLLRGTADQGSLLIATGSMSMDSANFVEVMEYDASTEELVMLEEIEHLFPVERIVWAPEGSGSRRDNNSFITCSDYIRLWRKEADDARFKLVGIFRPAPGCSGSGAPCCPYSGVVWCGDRVAACTRSGLLIVWSASTLDILRCSDFGSDTLNAMSLCDVSFVGPDVLAVCNTRGEVILVDLAEEDSADADVVVQRPPEEFPEQATSFMSTTENGRLGLMMQETGEVVCYRFDMKGEQGRLRFLTTVHTESSIAAASFLCSDGPMGSILCTANDNGRLSLWKWPDESRGHSQGAARIRPLYQWSLSLSNEEGLVSSVQLCNGASPAGDSKQALVLSTTGGRVIITFLPEEAPSNWEDQEVRQSGKAPRLSAASAASGRTRLSAASRLSESGRDRPWVLGNSTIRSSPMSAVDRTVSFVGLFVSPYAFAMRLRSAAPEAIIITTPPRPEEYPTWTAIALTWLAFFTVAFGLAYLLMWYRQRKHEKSVERHQKILEKQRLKRASLDALMKAAEAGEVPQRKKERKSKIGGTRRERDDDHSPEKASRRILAHHHQGPDKEHHKHNRRKVKERSRPTHLSPSLSPSAARTSAEERSRSPTSGGKTRKSKLLGHH